MGALASEPAVALVPALDAAETPPLPAAVAPATAVLPPTPAVTALGAIAHDFVSGQASVVDLMGEAYPEIREAQSRVAETVRLEEERFAAFLSGTDEITRAWDFQPLLSSFWPEVCRHANSTRLLGERFARARRSFERRWGCSNLELPVSSMCRTPTFAAFAWYILSQLRRFRDIHNSCLRDLRRRYRIRSRHHPVPDLEQSGDW